MAGGGETVVIGDARGATNAVHFLPLLTPPNWAPSPRREPKLELCSDENAFLDASFEVSDSRNTATVGTLSSKAPVAITPQVELTISKLWTRTSSNLDIVRKFHTIRKSGTKKTSTLSDKKP